jgi:methyl-accepting chemotaxis protein
MKLKYKLPLILFVAFVGIIAGTFTVSLTNMARLNSESHYETGKAIATAQAKTVTSFLEKKITGMRALESNIQAIRHLNDKDKLEILSKLVYTLSDQPCVSDVFVTFERGAYFSMDRTAVGKYYNVEAFHPTSGGGAKVLMEVDESDSVAVDDEWYNLPRDTKKLHLTEPYDWTYPDETKERRMITISAPIIVDGKFIGAAGIDLELDLLQKELFDGMADAKTGSYATFTSHEGLRAAHPNKDMLLVQVGQDMESADREALLDAIKKGEYYRTLKKNNQTGEMSLMSYVPVLPDGLELPWSLSYVTPLSALQADAKRVERSMITMGFVCAAAWGIFLLIFMSAIFGNITRTVEALSRMTEGDGDLTIRFQERGKDEFGMMACGLNGLMDKLHATIKTTQNEARNLSGTSASLLGLSENLSNSSETTLQQSITVSQKSEETSANVQEIAGEAERASATATELSATAEQMGHSMNTMVEAVGQMHESFSKITADTRESKAVAGMATEKVADAMGVMDALAKSAMEIGQSTDVIKSIAKKTNLLALNATVEAARAGEAGKGFAVVAGEVKQLANQSASNADDITHRIENIQNGTEHAIDAIKEISAIITKISESANSIAESVERQIKVSDNLANTAKDTNVGAQEVVKAVDDVANSIQIAAKNAGDAAEGTKNVSDSIGVIHGDAEKTNAYSTQLKETANSMREMAEGLDAIVSKFKT